MKYGEKLSLNEITKIVDKDSRDAEYYKKLKMNLLVPSANTTYSTCIETISKWFYNKFSKNFFHNVYIEYSHVFDQFRRKSRKDLVKIDNPALVITPSIDLSFNRENLDLYNYGNRVYNNRCSYKDAFFKDIDYNSLVSLTPEILLFNFNFKLRFNTKAQQLDIAKKCQLAFKSLVSEKLYMDIDFPVPQELMTQIAEDTHHDISGNDITKIINFVSYVNSHSFLPVMFKFDAGSGIMKYYLKLTNSWVHIKTGEITIDDGYRTGDIYTNFTVNFDCQVRYPSPKFYAYYSIIKRESIKAVSKLDEHSFVISELNVSRIPSKNEKGWEISIESNYTFDKKELIKIKNKEKISIDFIDLVKYNNIKNIIESTKELALNPEIFMDLKIFGTQEELEFSIDWINYKINFTKPYPYENIIIVIYLDLKYFNDKNIELNKYGENRVQPSNTKFNRVAYNKNNPLQINKQ